MQGAHERNVLRWEARQAMLDTLILSLESELTAAAHDATRASALQRQLAQVRRRRTELGPSPHPKMG
ncbi:MAG TPA: hypothetical protein VF916_05265 [Ktedonobacterales bacterium]